MIAFISRRLAGKRDAGFGLVMTMLFVALAGVITTTTVMLISKSLKSASRDRQALSAISTAEGGVAQAIQVIRRNPPGYFTCKEPAAGAAPTGACVTNPVGWTNALSPEKVSNGTVGSCLPAQPCYLVWISTLVAFNPLPYPNGAGVPARTVTYRIHSTGMAGNGPAARSVIVDITATLATFPMGLYADAVSTNGSPGVHHESVFSLGCITNRSQDGANGSGLSFDAYDPADPYSDYDWGYDLPEAAHSASVVSTSSSCTQSSSNKGAIHHADPCANVTGGGSNYDYFPYDQDAMGGSLSGTPCNDLWTSPVTGRQYATTSLFTTQDLYSSGYRPQGLTPQEYDALKEQAIAMGTYFTGSPSGSQISTALSAVGSNNAVLYIDANGSSVSFGPNDIPSQFFRATLPPGQSVCPLASLVIVVRNGNLTYNATGFGGGSSNLLVASIFVPDGSYDGQGSAEILGTVFAKSITLRGTQDIYLDQCFVQNPPALLEDLKQVNYAEVNSQNLQ